jgi:hypothetical protein
MKTLLGVLLGLSLSLSAFAETRHRQFNYFLEIYQFVGKHPHIKAGSVVKSVETRTTYLSDGSVKEEQLAPILILYYED